MTPREQERLRQKVIECLRDDMTHAFWNPCAVEAQMHRDEAHEAALRVEYFAAHPRRWRVRFIDAQLWHITNDEFIYCFETAPEAYKAAARENLRLMGGIVFG